MWSSIKRPGVEHHQEARCVAPPGGPVWSSTRRPWETHLLALHLPEGRVGASLEAAELSLQFPPLPLGDRGGVHSLGG